MSKHEMQKIGQRVKTVRSTLGLSQQGFADRMGYSRNYVSMIERGASDPSQRFQEQLSILEKTSAPADIVRPLFSNVVEQPARYRRSALPRMIPVYSLVQAGAATAYEELPAEAWEDQIEYSGPDTNAFALRVTGDSMEPRFPPGTVLTVSPAHPPSPGQHVVASIKNEGALFKIFHHSADHKTVTLTSYNPVYPPLTRPREAFHWIYRVVHSKQNH